MTEPAFAALERSAHEVLVVDDNHVTRYATARVLRAAGFRTREAGTGAEALRLAGDGVAAVVLDVHLPDIDGFEVVRVLRRQPQTARLPVIHLSAQHVRDDDKVRGLDSGADAYLTHPADPAVLIATVQALVRTRVAEEALRRSEAQFREQHAQLLEREQAARAAAERALRARDDFIAVLSHELRTPLNAIMGWAHVLQKRGVPEDALPGLRAIERNAKTQARLISDILDVSRMSTGKLRLDPERVDPAELTAASVAALAPSFADKRLEVRQQLAAAGAPMWLDPARYQQIVWNLLTNAIKFSQPGGAIEVELRREEAGLALAIVDHGQGIRPEFLPYLFDRFTQGDSSSNRYHGGLGLGLSIVKHLVDLHGGSVEGFSQGLGHGARFVVRLPDRAPSEPLLVDAAGSGFGELAEPRAGEPALAGVKVLVVDDDAEACAMLSVILGDRGAEVRAVQSSEAALAELAAFAPDVVVSDIGMPGADGYAFVRALREREAAGGPRLPVIALTAFTRAQDRDMARETGFDAHCDKPLRPGVLVEQIIELLRRA